MKSKRKRSIRRLGTVERLEDRNLLATFAVLNNNDAGAGSLRQAIFDANATPGIDTISFAISSASKKISLQSGLPWLEEPTHVDATTQPGFAGTPLVQLDGAATTDSSVGLRLRGGNSSVKGLSITNFNSGVWINSSNNTVVQNFLGLAPDSSPAGNRFEGIYLQNATNNLLNGNVISANQVNGIRIDGVATVGNRIQGNLIGTDATGLLARGNKGEGVLLDTTKDNIVGTDGDGANDLDEGNIIAANGANGIRIFASQATKVAGNIIGADINGEKPLANLVDGILIDTGSTGNTVGTDGDGIADDVERNLISGNTGNGIRLDKGRSNVVSGNLIGTKLDGVSALANGGSGVLLSNQDTNTLIGTNADGLSDDVEGNIISGNARNGISILGAVSTMVTGNFIGTGIDGSTKVSNSESGIWVSGDSNAAKIGIYKDGADDLVVGNIISGNLQFGIASLRSTNLTIAGNFIGTDISGGVRLANGKSGISLDADVTDASIGAELAGLPGGFVGNVISGNAENGISISNSASRINIGSNIIGLGIDGATLVPNDLSGISIVDGASQIVVGGELFDQSNTISSNGRYGVFIRLSSGNSIFGNLIGLAADGQSPAGNALSGIRIEQSSNTRIGYDPQGTSGNFPDATNFIAYNGTTGIAISGELSQGNQINQNQIFGHSQIAVDLGSDGPTPNDATDSDTGPNGLQNFPVLQVVATNPLATQISGSLQGDPNETYLISFYVKQGSGTVIDSMEFLDSISVNTNATGQVSWTANLDLEVPAGNSVIANARSTKNGTSEFSAARDTTTLRALTLTFASPSVLENVGSVQLTIDRGDLPIAQGITLTLTSSDRPLVNPPATVVLPSGTQSVTIAVPITDNNKVELDRTVEVAATLFGVALGKTQIDIVDNTESVWHNSVLARDVNGDSSITPVDALLIISLLNRFGSSREVSQLTPPAVGVFYPDVNDDGIVSPVDVLQIIAALNRSGGSAEGESTEAGDQFDSLEREKARRRIGLPLVHRLQPPGCAILLLAYRL